MFYNFIQKVSYRFRRFSNKAYSAFASMHRHVTIGQVSYAICDMEMLKAGRCLVLCGVMALPNLALADESSQGLSADELAQQLSLQEVLVQATKTEDQAHLYRTVATVDAAQLLTLPVSSVSDMLTYLPGLDVRTRGNNGCQADVSLRGGTFDQVRIMVNGIDLSDAHTGHYTMNLPISASLIERIEVLDGAVNIVTKSATDTIRTQARMTAGMYGLINPELSLTARKGGWEYSASAEYNRADGYNAPDPVAEKERTALENSDYKIANFYFRAKGVVDIQAGAQFKNVGAGMYYGFGSQTQYEATRTAFASISHSHRWGAWSLDTKAAYRVNYDHYRWWRDEPVKGANQHLTQNAHLGLEGHYVSWLGTTTVGLSFTNNHIYSTNLGDSVRPIRISGRELALGDNRLDIDYYAAQTFHYGILDASLRADGHYNSRFGNYCTGNANIGVTYANNGNTYINISHSRRLPTFTDLYYNAGNQLGSRDLKPEQLTTFTLGTHYGYKGLNITADGFYRLGRNIIDWVEVDYDSKRPFHATNQNNVNAAGTEVTVGYSLNDWLRLVQVRYAYTWLDLDLEKTGSRYLDYLSHKLVAQVEHGIYVSRKWKIGAAWTLTYRRREGQFKDTEGIVRNYKPNLLLDGQLYWQHPRVTVLAEVTNMTNRRVYDYGGILLPGAWAKGTIKVNL